MASIEILKKLEITSIDELRNWLILHNSTRESIWLVTFKKSVIGKYVSRDEVLDELLCFGWIDGVRKKLDADRTMQLISPRKSQHWAGTYKERAKKLIENEKMHKAGYQSIERSKKEGLWNFMDDVDALIIPKDLEMELAKYESASLFFQNINDSSKRFVLRWVKLAKTEKTRENRIKKIAKLASVGEKLPGS